MFNLQEHQDVDIDSTNLTERSLAFLLSRETFLIINNIHFFFTLIFIYYYLKL